jgi:hypothetical protein
VMRVYELGPARGRKVVFVHDSNSPSVVARDLLWEFVGRGCRVLTFGMVPAVPHHKPHCPPKL